MHFGSIIHVLGLLLVVTGSFMVLTDDMDYVTAMSSVIATLMNIGPGFGAVGPSENYALSLMRASGS